MMNRSASSPRAAVATLAVLVALLAVGTRLDGAVVAQARDADAAALIDALVATPWSDETFPTGDEASAEEIRTAIPGGEGEDAVGGVSIAWPNGPWTLSYLVFDGEDGPIVTRDALIRAAETDGRLSVSSTWMDGADGTCVGPVEVLPGSPDPASCVAVSREVMVLTEGDDHDASRLAYLLFAAIAHLQAVQASLDDGSPTAGSPVAASPAADPVLGGTDLYDAIAASDLSAVDLPAGLDGADAEVWPYDDGDSDVAGAVGGVGFGWAAEGFGVSYYVYPSSVTAAESFAGRAEEFEAELLEETTVLGHPALVLIDAGDEATAVLVLVDDVIVAAIGFVGEDGSTQAEPDVVVALAQAGVEHLTAVREAA